MTKKTCLIGVIGTAVVMLSACAQKGEQRTSGEDEKTDEVEVKTDIQSDDADEWADEDVLPDGKCLNDIRFETLEKTAVRVEDYGTVACQLSCQSGNVAPVLNLYGVRTQALVYACHSVLEINQQRGGCSQR